MPKSRWSINRNEVVVSTDDVLEVQVPLYLDGVKVATVKLVVTDLLQARFDFLTEPAFSGLVDFQAWEHPAGGGS